MKKEIINTCCFCGKPYTNYGNSTWGYWQLHGYTEIDDNELGEKARCCDKCNFYYVIPSRIKLSE